MSTLELQQSIYDSLQHLRNLDVLKKMFWSQLNYERVNQALSRRSWTEAVTNELVEDPLLLATGGNNNDFHVIYARLKFEQLSRERERRVVNRLLLDHPYALFIFSNQSQSQWHFLNVKYDNTPEKRKLFRRITVGEGEQLRTATERLSLLDMESINANSPLFIQQQHDEAFDVEAVTQQFFTEYRKVFEKVEGLIDWNTDADRKRLFTQKLFNRLMFIAFIQKKDWLKFKGRTDYLSALWEAYLEDDSTSNKNFYRDRLSHLFFTGLNNPQQYDIVGINKGGYLKDLIGTVPYLNGGLFEQAEDDNDQVIVSDECIDTILHELFQRFAFTVTESTPLDVEVAVDPEMLGKVFEELVTGRHESGSYYTPKPIVSFMCREALKGYLKTQAFGESQDAIAQFVEEHNPVKLNNPEAILEALRRVKCCDLAAGSGAYLLGMLHELLDLRQCLFATKGLDSKTVYKRKLEIIESNLYGVDIDVFAINIARLRLWLSLAVEYQGNDPPPLPNLKYKIEIGDSLIAPSPTGVGTIRDELIRSYRQAKADYMGVHEGGKKRKLEQEINKLKTQIALITHGSTKISGFDWAVEFAEVFADGGFDIVVANPPYVRADAQFKHLKYNEQVRQATIAQWKIYRDRLKRSQIYQTLYEKWDLYIPFLERAYQLLRSNGQMIFIIPDAYNAAKYTDKSHDFFLKHTRIERIDFCSDIPIFKAKVYNTILHFNKASYDKNHQPIRIRHWGNKSDDFTQNIEIISTDSQIQLGASLFKVKGTQRGGLVTKVVPLEAICYISWGLRPCSDEKKHRGLFIKNDLISDVQDDKHPKSFIEGKDTVKWWVDRVRYLEWNTERAPSLFARPTFPELYNVPEKILAMDISGNEPRAAYDDKQRICNNSVSCCVPWYYLEGIRNKSIKKRVKYKDEFKKDDLPSSLLREQLEEISQQFSLKYLLAVMHSTFAKEWLTHNRRSHKHIYPDDWKALPIAIISMTQQIEFVRLVDAILAEFQQHGYPLPSSSAQRVADLEREIDERVATLYSF